MFLTYYSYPAQRLFRVYNPEKDAFTTEDKVDANISSFYIRGKGYENTDEDLKRYYTDLKEASKELRDHQFFDKWKQGFDYVNPFKMQSGEWMYRTHNKNVITFFNMQYSIFKNKDVYNALQPITRIEEVWSSKCFNAGLYYSIKTDHPIQSYGHDFVMFYPSRLASPKFQMPIKPGKQVKVKDLKEYGYYSPLESSDFEAGKVNSILYIIHFIYNYFLFIILLIY